MKKLTKETLQNTCGVVESKENAEFIAKLAELREEFKCDEGGCFYTCEHCLYFATCPDVASNEEEKQITIPLPPKNEISPTKVYEDWNLSQKDQPLTPEEETELKHKAMVAALSVDSMEPRNIKLQDGAVCFADGVQWFYESNYPTLSSAIGNPASYESLVDCDDFQLNEIRQGDCIEASEFDTEQEYSDALEVFELFGWSFPARAVSDYESLEDGNVILCDVDFELYQNVRDTGNRKRKLTYLQIMAIGKLKRAMIERDKPNFSDLPKHFDCRCNKCGGKCCAGTCDNWPQVGDDVVIADQHNKLEGELLALTKEYAIISQDYGEQHLHLIGWSFEKPKSPQDLIIEELQTKLCENNYTDNYTLANDIVNGIIEGLVYSGSGK